MNPETILFIGAIVVIFVLLLVLLVVVDKAQDRHLPWMLKRRGKSKNQEPIKRKNEEYDRLSDEEEAGHYVTDGEIINVIDARD